ncbi:unnamed protein product [Phytophthora fragariaefolia]|uniref:Unnamed protein product n=1 Tax=Phytophthora fragariaefolia TaxID=1490495 RepID=A0A9W7DAZ5_9STRA|nr:unnamed protein product [Phytophthora fragariaefolia]
MQLSWFCLLPGSERGNLSSIPNTNDIKLISTYPVNPRETPSSTTVYTIADSRILVALPSSHSYSNALLSELQSPAVSPSPLLSRALLLFSGLKLSELSESSVYSAIPSVKPAVASSSRSDSSEDSSDEFDSSVKSQTQWPEEALRCSVGTCEL